MSSTLQASVFMVKNYSDNWHSIKNTEDLTMKQMFDISEKLITEQSDEIYVMNKSSVSCTQRSTYFQILYCVLKRWTRTLNQICMGRQIDVVQKFIRTQNFGQNWWWANGIRVEYLPRIHHIAARRQSPRVHEQNGRPSTIPRTNYLHVDVQWHHMGIKRQWKRMRVECSTRFPICKEIWSRTMVIPRTWIGKEMVFYLHRQTTRRMGQSRWIDDQIRRKRTPSFRATSPLSRGTLKSKGGGKLSIHFCADGDTIEIVFRIKNLLINPVSTEQSQICVRNTVPVKQERGDHNLTHCSSQQNHC